MKVMEHELVPETQLVKDYYIQHRHSLTRRREADVQNYIYVQCQEAGEGMHSIEIEDDVRDIRRIVQDVLEFHRNTQELEFHKNVEELERSRCKTYIKSLPVEVALPKTSSEQIAETAEFYVTDQYVLSRVKGSLLKATLLPLAFSLFLVVGTSITVTSSMAGERLSILREHLPQLVLFGLTVFAFLWLPTMLFWVRNLPSFKLRVHLVNRALQSLNQYQSDVQDSI